MNFELGILFIIFAVAGVLGETLFCFSWKILHGKPLWEYTIAPIFGKYSSWLNFIPWGISGFLFWGIFEFLEHLLNSSYQFPIFSVGIVLGTLFLFPVIFILLRKKKKIRNIRVVLIIQLVPLIFIATLNEIMFFFLVGGGLVSWFLEYLYGKIARWIFGQSLWQYCILPKDDGHLSFATLPGFSMAGLFFLLVYQLFLWGN